MLTKTSLLFLLTAGALQAGVEMYPLPINSANDMLDSIYAISGDGNSIVYLAPYSTGSTDENRFSIWTRGAGFTYFSPSDFGLSSVDGEYFRSISNDGGIAFFKTSNGDYFWTPGGGLSQPVDVGINYSGVTGNGAYLYGGTSTTFDLVTPSGAVTSVIKPPSIGINYLSNDGSTLIGSSSGDYSISRDGGAFVPFTYNGGSVRVQGVSGDGSTIAFVVNDALTNPAQTAYNVFLDQNGATTQFAVPLYNAGAPFAMITSISADGSRVLVESYGGNIRGENGYALYRGDLDLTFVLDDMLEEYLPDELAYIESMELSEDGMDLLIIGRTSDYSPMRAYRISGYQYLVPEPSTYAAIAGLVGFGCVLWSRRRRA